MFGIIVAIIALALAVTAHLTSGSRSMPSVLPWIMLVIATVFLNQVLAYLLQDFLPSFTIFTLVFAIVDVVSVAAQLCFAAVSFVVFKWSDHVLRLLLVVAVLLRSMVYAILHKSIASLLAVGLHVYNTFVAYFVRILLSPLPSLALTFRGAPKDRKYFDEWLSQGTQHLALAILRLVLFVSLDPRTSKFFGNLYMGYYFVFNVKATTELVIGLHRNMPGYRLLLLPSYQQANTWLLDVVKRFTGTVIRMMILAIRSVSDLFSDVARQRQTPSEPSLSARRPRTPGIETLELRRLSSPFASQPTKTDGTFSRWIKDMWGPSKHPNPVPFAPAINPKQLFTNIPTAPIRRIDSVFLNGDDTSPSIISTWMSALCSLFKRASTRDNSVGLNDHGAWPSTDKESSGSDSDIGYDSDASVDDLVSGIRTINLASGSSPSLSRYHMTPQSEATHNARGSLMQGNALEQEQRAHVQAQQATYDFAVFRSKLPPVPTVQGVTFTPLRAAASSPWERFNNSNVGYPAPMLANPIPTGGAVYQALSAGHSQDLQRTFGRRSAMKGGRARYPLTRHDIVRNNKIVFQEQVQVESVWNWIDRTRDVQSSTHEHPCYEEEVALQHSVFWLERERMAGLL